MSVTAVALFVALVAVGATTGVVAGTLGVGGGILMVPFLTLVVGTPQHAAEGTSLLVILPTALAASIALHRRGVGNLRVALAVGGLGAAGGAAGALLALALPAETLRLAFAGFIAVVGARLVGDALAARGGRA
jgi:uncharacterized membrane protein YfcA